MTLNDVITLILRYFTKSTRLRLHTYCTLLYRQRSHVTPCLFHHGAAIPFKISLLIYRKVGHTSISYYCDYD